ncbi:MAG: ROK family transcriptional regulator [Anaerolineae bacterium]|nr:ROK family transcriptional regulator [Anaerolineae bacterium]
MTQKATREGLKSHNRRLVLRSVFTEKATNRAAIAQYTGLAKPTISDIVAELIEDGLVEELGHGESTESGGKRPILLHFRPESRQIISISVDSTRVQGILTNLNGDVIARHRAYIEDAVGYAPLDVLVQVINGLIAQSDYPLLCISIGTPGIVYSDLGVVKSAPSLGWHDLLLENHLSTLYDVPVCVANNTELATRALRAFKGWSEDDTVVMVLVNGTVEIGIAFGGGVYHHSGDLGLLRVPPATDQLASFLGWEFVERRIDELRPIAPDNTLPDTFDYLDIRYGYVREDWLCAVIYDELAGHLSQIFAWITGILRPNRIVLAGEIVEMGEELMQLATNQTTRLLPPDLVDAVTFSLETDTTLSLRGAIAHALDRELGVIS